MHKLNMLSRTTSIRKKLVSVFCLGPVYDCAAKPVKNKFKVKIMNHSK